MRKPRPFTRTWPISPIAAIFPASTEADYAAVRTRIQQQGQRQPIVLWRGAVIDGRNRLRACRELGIECRAVEFRGDDPVEFVLATNTRTHTLDRGQRSALLLAARRVYTTQKRKWIADARQEFAPGAREVCAVCNRYQAVAHAHHLTPLHLQFDRGATVPDQAFAWLCPTHHVAVHEVLDRHIELKALAGFTRGEKTALAAIVAGCRT
jgi:hypothetical protein